MKLPDTYNCLEVSCIEKMKEEDERRQKINAEKAAENKEAVALRKKEAEAKRKSKSKNKPKPKCKSKNIVRRRNDL